MLLCYSANSKSRQRRAQPIRRASTTARVVVLHLEGQPQRFLEQVGGALEFD